MNTAQPSGTVTLVFTDIEGSTRLLEKLGTDVYREALAEHRRVVRDACVRHDGYEVDCEGDAFFVTFHTAPAAVAAVTEAMQGLEGGPIRIRVGIHTGQPGLDGPNYIGMDVHRAARIMSAAHGGQVVLSPSTVTLLDGSVELNDLGEHRLKDLTAPVRLHQLTIHGLPDQFPPLKTLYRSNLPVPATPFLGREHELAEVVARLTEPHTRLLTLTGPGGTGKTRLALQAAADVADNYPDGVYWVPLASLRDPGLVLSTLASLFELTERPEEPLTTTMARRLAGTRMLLLLDNVEHLLPAVAHDIAALTGSGADVRVLVTSRERLLLEQERVWRVPSMSEPDAERLFVDRARSSGADITVDDTLRELCRRLDHLPLAIQLAAARVRSLSPRSILERLDQRLPTLVSRARDADERQQTLDAAIAWSYDLLDLEEQRVLRGLSVFRGGCTREPASAVVDADLDALESLLDKSLLGHRVDETGEDRYWMLETIRDYATGRLEACGDAEALRRRHAAYFLEFAEARGVRGAFDDHLHELAREHDNLRAALETFRGDGETAAQLRLARALARFWYRGGHLREGIANLEAALEHAPDVPVAIACDAFGFASYIAADLGDVGRAATHASRELELARGGGTADEVADALVSVGCVAELRRDFAEARAHFEAALETAEVAGYEAGIVVASTHLADLALYEGDHDGAAALLEASTELVRTLGWGAGLSAGLINLARARLLQHRPADAVAALRDAAGPTQNVPVHLVGWLEAAAATVEAEGDDHGAAMLVGAADAIRHVLGAELDPFDVEPHSAMVSRLRRALGAGFDGAYRQGASLTQSEALALGLSSMALEDDRT